MKTSGAGQSQSASALISKRIAELGDWRGKTLNRMRTLIKKADLLLYRAMIVDIMAKVKALRAQGKSLPDVLAANLTAPYDKTTLGDTPQSKSRFITEVYDEVGPAFPPVVDGKRTMPRRP